LGEGDSELKARVLAALSRALIFTGHVDRAEAIGQQAMQMARRLGEPAALAATLRAGTTVACFGSACRYLGMLATTMRCWEEAQRHFADALVLPDRLERYWLARLQVGHRSPG
jgi:hypothetical protein